MFCLSVTPSKDADGIANKKDPDQTASLGAVRARSALFARICLFEKSESIYMVVKIKTIRQFCEFYS